jgi:aminopeptidase N
MIKHSLTLTFLLSLLTLYVQAQQEIPRLSQLDVQHYRFELSLSDDTDEIKGIAHIRIKFLQELPGFTLDLVAQGEGKMGMLVQAVKEDDQSLQFRQAGEELSIQLGTPTKKGEEKEFTIQYSGIPKDGLIIDTNKHGKRTFFGDNWPNRAHHWLPTVDHPSDKASVEFIVTAPEHYQVIANGIQIEETNLPGRQKLTHYREEVPLPTKVVVIGAAAFAVQLAGEVNGIPITSWIYPEDRKAGFYDYAQALQVLPFFIEKVGPYSYSKLANVQSKTRYGGMENAGNIFYYENSVSGERDQEGLIVHEVAHQWFGNSASEANWFHVWLSEGFATYFTTLYFEDRHGLEAARELLLEDREEIIDFAAGNNSPIINTAVTDYNDLLNTNAYQKGGWVLHMLRRKIGNEAFWQGIREYYRQYRNSNALTEDLQRIMEKASAQKLGDFFQQWLYRGGLPLLNVQWEPTGKRNKIRVTVQQTQEAAAFQFPLDILISTSEGKTELFTLNIKDKTQTEVIKIKGTVTNIELDPDVKLLFGE